MKLQGDKVINLNEQGKALVEYRIDKTIRVTFFVLNHALGLDAALSGMRLEDYAAIFNVRVR